MQKASRNSVAVAACTYAIDPARPGELQLTPAGQFRARDGRPAGLAAWQIDAAIAAQVIVAARARQTPFVIDYEHQTLLAEQNGQPAPAAGWFSRLEWREGEGLFATDVTWTERAAQMIAAKEYRYVSPVFRFDPQSGAVRALEMAALTNNPALDGLREVELRAAAKYSTHEDVDMNPILTALLSLLGLADSATEAEATAALKAIIDKVAAKDTEIAALKTLTPDPAKYVPIEAVKQLQQDIAALKAADQGRDVDELVRRALDEGRLLPALEDWARELGKKDLAALRAYVEQAAPIAALAGTQTGGTAPSGGGKGALSESDLAICKQLGLSEAEYRAANGLQAA